MNGIQGKRRLAYTGSNSDRWQELDMATDKAELIRLLEAELNMIESGAYAPHYGEPTKTQPMFVHSLVCINHWLVPGHESECHDDCVLMKAVPEKKQTEPFPCHYIPLNAAGET